MEWEKNIMNMIGRTFPFFCYKCFKKKFYFLYKKMQNKNVKLLYAFWKSTHQKWKAQ